MENNKQTAVNYLLSHIWTTDWVNYTREEKLAIIEQAKEKEKQQIINAQMDMFIHLNNLPYGLEYLEKRQSAEDFSQQYYNCLLYTSDAADE